MAPLRFANIKKQNNHVLKTFTTRSCHLNLEHAFDFFFYSPGPLEGITYEVRRGAAIYFTLTPLND